MEHITHLYSLDQREDIAYTVYAYAKNAHIITFTGPLGAGKTTLIQALCRLYGVTESVTSPTFTYLNVYRAPELYIYHFDLYRLKTIDDFFMAGFDEYLYLPQSKVLIEWPAIIMPLLTHSVCHLAIDYHHDADKRVLSMVCQ